MIIFSSCEYKFVTLCNVWLGICGNRRKMYQFYISINNSNCKKNVLYLLDFVAFRIFFCILLPRLQTFKRRLFLYSCNEMI